MSCQEPGAGLYEISTCRDNTFTASANLLFIQRICFKNDLKLMAKGMCRISTGFQVCRHFIIFTRTQFTKVCDNINFSGNVIFSNDLNLLYAALCRAVSKRKICHRAEFCISALYIRLTKIHICRIDADSGTSELYAVFCQFDDFLFCKFGF